MMNRKEIKAKGKEAFKANYWRAVFVAFILAFAMGLYSASATSSFDTEGTMDLGTTEQTYSFSYSNSDDSSSPITFEGSSTDKNELPFSFEASTFMASSFFALLLSFFLFGPLEIGCRNFFKKNLRTKADLNELNASFTPNYWRKVATMFLMDLFLALWTLLFIVPGIVMSYAYRLTPYIAEDDPDLPATECIKKSKAMMKGHKWELFVFDLSFLGWFLLDIFTVGIVGLFYVRPYYRSAQAQYYQALRDSLETPAVEAPVEAPVEA